MKLAGPENLFWKRVILFSLGTIVFLLGLGRLLEPVNASSGFAGGVRLNKVEKVEDISGGKIRLALSGEGFVPGTRVSLTPDYGNRRLVRSRLPLWGIIYDLALDNHLAFIANGYQGLVIVDVRDPDGPQVLSNLNLPGRCFRVAVRDQLAFVAAVEGGVHVVDVGDPRQPRLLASLNPTHKVFAVCVSGNFLLLSGGPEGLYVIDIADPTSPRLLGRLDTPGDVSGIAVRYPLVFMSNNRGSLLVANVKDPRSPQLLANLVLPGPAWDLLLHDDLVLLAVSGAGLVAVDASDPVNPEIRRTLPGIGQASRVTEDRNRVYLGTSYGVMAADLDQMDDWQWLGGAKSFSRVSGMAVENGTVYLAGADPGLEVVDLSNPSLIEWFRNKDYFSRINGMYLDDQRLLLLDNWNGLNIIAREQILKSWKAKPTANPVFTKLRVFGDRWGAIYREGHGLLIQDLEGVSTLREFQGTSGHVQDFWMSGDLLYLADDAEGLVIFDLGSTRVRRLGSLLTNGTPLQIGLDGRWCYLADGLSGMKVVDIADPTRPRQVAEYLLPGKTVSLCLLEKHLVVALEGGGLALFDRSDPGAPRLLSIHQDGKLVKHVRSEGELVAVACSWQEHGSRSKVILYRVGPLGLEKLVETPEGFGAWKGFELKNDHLYVERRGNEIAVFIYRPATGLELEEIVTLDSVFNSFAVHGDQLLVSDVPGNLLTLSRRNGAFRKIASQGGGQGKGLDFSRDLVYQGRPRGFDIIDISTPDNPQKVGGLELPGMTQALVQQSDIVFLAARDAGLHLVDVGNPEAPRLLSTVDTQGSAVDVAVSGDRAWVADREGGVLQFDVADPTQPRLVGKFAYPYPLDAFSLALDVEIQEDRVYVADGYNGLMVIDARDPDRGAIIARLDAPGFVPGVAVGPNNFVAVSANREGLLCFDLADPSRPLLVGRLDVPDGAVDCLLDGQRMLVRTGGEGFFVGQGPREATAVERLDGNRLLADFADPGWSGYYTVRVFNQEGGAEMIGAVFLHSGAEH